MEEKNSSKLSRALRFAELLNEFRLVERALYANGTKRMENDVEHSYGLAMLAWYIIDSENLSLDTSLVVKYALVHDLVEVYAGDTYVFSKDKDHLESKEERERESAEKLRENFSEFPELHDLIGAYEAKADDESRFVYALDKIQPDMNIYLDGGRAYKKLNETHDMISFSNKKKVAVSPEIEEYFNELMELLKKKEEQLFS